MSLIVAMDSQRGIGYRGALPWRLSADLRRFKELTMGHHLIVGRKTFESIGRPLPGRKMIVVTHRPSYEAEGISVAHSIERAVELARANDEQELFICGGAQIYDEMMGMADRIYLTRINATVECDTFFPEFDCAAWTVTRSDEHRADQNNEYPFTFLLLERKVASVKP